MMKLLFFAILIAKLFANSAVNWIFALIALGLLGALAIYAMNRSTLEPTWKGAIYLLIGFMLCILFLFVIGVI